MSLVSKIFVRHYCALTSLILSFSPSLSPSYYSDEELSEEDIDREFYGEDFDSEMPRSSVQSKSSGERGKKL